MMYVEILFFSIPQMNLNAAHITVKFSATNQVIRTSYIIGLFIITCHFRQGYIRVLLWFSIESYSSQSCPKYSLSHRFIIFLIVIVSHVKLIIRINCFHWFLFFFFFFCIFLHISVLIFLITLSFLSATLSFLNSPFINL